MKRFSARKKPFPEKPVFSRRNIKLSLAERRAITRAKKTVREARKLALTKGLIGEEYEEGVIAINTMQEQNARVKSKRLNAFEKTVIKQTIKKEQKKFAENREKIFQLNPELSILHNQEKTQINLLGKKMQSGDSMERGIKMALTSYSAIKKISTKQSSLLESIEKTAKKKLTPELLETLKEMQLAAGRNQRAATMLFELYKEK